MRPMPFLLLTLVSMTGCHRVCGVWSPIWVQADCAIVPVPEVDSGFAGCDATLTVEVDGGFSQTASPDGQVALTGVLQNITDAPITFTVTEPCPDGLVRFEGLGAGYDYYGSCVAGVCANTGEVTTYTLDPGESLGSATTLHLGGDTCNDAVGLGTYEISGSLPLTDAAQPTICASAAELFVE
ncbi:MAG: hypothetical protein EP330_27955 [Deltaproteobacteria bacterium]|nr:MAG: hypothetical protein EP330_27955 [Deltaproteobacteria bacterium]